MVSNKIKILIILFIVIISAAFFVKVPSETNMIKAILPSAIEDYDKIVSLSDKTNLTVKVVFEAENEQKLNEIKNNFFSKLNENDFSKSKFDTSKLLKWYLISPNNFLSYNSRKLLKERKYTEFERSATEKLNNPSFVKLVPYENDPYFLLDDFLKENLEQKKIANFDNKFYETTTIKVKNEHALASLTKLSKVLSNKSSKIYLTGTPIHSYYTNLNAKKSINIICILSILLIALITYLYFKSIKPVIIAGLSILFGFLAGFGALKVLHGNFHIITLVFATTLIGIGVDYTYHYLYKENENKNFVKNLSYSLISTILAFFVLYLSDIEILMQISIFLIFGLSAIYIFIMLSYHLFKFPKPQKISLFHFHKRKYFLILLIIVSFLGYFKLSFDDTLNAFYNPSDELKKAENLYNKISQNDKPVKIVTFEADNFEKLLEKEEEITDSLIEQKIDFYAMSKIMPSKKRQKENIALVEDLYRNNLRAFSEVMDISHLHSILYANKTAIEPFEIDDFMLNKNCSLALIYSDKLPQNLKEINPNQEISNYLKNFRIFLLKLLPFVYMAVFIFFCIVYKFKTALKIILPALSGSVCAIGLISLMGQSINFFSIIAIFLILGFTIDYSIFRVSGGKNSNDAILISCITTSFSFLALSFTSFKFISSLSLILFLGIVISYITGRVLFFEESEQT